MEDFSLCENLYKDIVNSLSSHIAILDENGVILATNRAWQEFARENGLPAALDWQGMNYLAICDRTAASCLDVHELADGIRRVIAGEAKEYVTRYPCRSRTEKRWYTLRVVGYRSTGLPKVIVTHEDITPVMEAQEALIKKEAELSAGKQLIEETNVALKVLMQHREQDKIKTEEQVLANVVALIMPYVEKLRQTPLDQRQLTLLGIIETHLQEIISPFLTRMSAIHQLLTPQEIKVAALVRAGKTSKEIADALQVTASAVDFHRKKLREKLGLSNTSSNLRTYLLSLH